MDVKLTLLVGLLAMGACTPPAAPSAIPRGSFTGSDGKAHTLVDASANFTVIEFFSAHCPCQSAHDTRLRALASTYAARGVAFVAIDSEVGASAARAQGEAAQRRYTYPILVDPGGVAARSLGADYATYTLLVDREGRVLYAGGIDSDKSHLRGDATHYLRDALGDVLAGRPVQRPGAESLGCALMLR